MDITVKQPVTLETIQSDLQQKFPQYTYMVRKTLYGPMLVIKQSNFVGAGIRLVQNNTVIKVFPAFPSLWVQALMGGLVFYAFVYSKMKNVVDTTGMYLQETYGKTIDTQ